MAEPETPYLVLAGPTAVGKTELAIGAALRLGGEIVVADARQVYRGLDVGTAKPGPAERARVPHHLLDVVEVGEPYSAADFARDARIAIAAIAGRGRTPLVVGGSGFYLEALAAELDPIDVEIGAAGRERARDRVAAIPVEERHPALAAVDPRLAARLHPHDRQRVERGLRVWFATGRPLSELQTGGGPRRDPPAVRLTRPAGEIARRIEVRLDAMLEAGLEAEARRLWASGATPATPGVDTIGYQEWWPLFDGRASRDEVRQRILVATRRYAKRQRTWFRHQGAYVPVPAADGVDAVLEAWRR